MLRPPRHVVSVTLVVTLVVLAGCNGLVGGGGGSSSDDGVNTTVTPVSVPETGAKEGATGETNDRGDAATPTPMPRAEDLPPGVTSSGLTDRHALREAHRAALANRSYTVRVRREGSNDLDFTVRVGENGTYLIAGPSGTTVVYGNATVTYRREYDIVNGTITNVTNDVTVRERVDPRFPRPGLSKLPTGPTESITWVESNGSSLVRIHAVESPRRLQNYSATVYVRPTGLVRTLVLSYDRRLVGGRRIHQLERYHYRAIGSTTVTEPDWVTRAKHNGSASATRRPASP